MLKTRSSGAETHVLVFRSCTLDEEVGVVMMPEVRGDAGWLVGCLMFGICLDMCFWTWVRRENMEEKGRKV